MTQKKQHREPEDKLLNDFFQDYALEQPSENLIKNTMSEILHEWSQQPIGQEAPLKLSHKLWIVLGVACSIILIYLVDFKNASNSGTISETLNLDKNGQLFINAFDSIINSFTVVPSLVYIIIAGIGLIFLLDKFLATYFKTIQE